MGDAGDPREGSVVDAHDVSVRLPRRTDPGQDRAVVEDRHGRDALAPLVEGVDERGVGGWPPIAEPSGVAAPVGVADRVERGLRATLRAAEPRFRTGVGPAVAL